MPDILRKLRITNALGRDATINFRSLRAKSGVYWVDGQGKPVNFRRFVAATGSTTHEALVEKYGQDYGQALIDDDPELDLEQVGRAIDAVRTIYLTHAGEVLHAAPRWQEVVYDAAGNEVERRDPIDRPANINLELPVRWSKTRLPLSELCRRFVISRTLLIRHVDGLTYDYLFEMAKDLFEKQEAVRMGAGKVGKDPLVLQANGTPYHAFLSGEVDGERYRLLMHLSNTELKRPVPTEDAS